MKKLIITLCSIILIFIVAIFCGIISYTITLNKIQVAKNNEKYINISRAQNYHDEKSLYEQIHEMANSKIVAEDGRISSSIEITKNDIDKLIVIIDDKRFEDSKKLLQILNRWKKNDFSKIVDDHNYVWSKLGGTVGKAIGIKK
jgi:hypothetical protein